jgi:hypothetical protein
MYTASLPGIASVGRPRFKGGTLDFHPSAHSRRKKTEHTVFLLTLMSSRKTVGLYGVTTQKIALFTAFNLIYNILCLPGWRVGPKPRLRETDIYYIHGPSEMRIQFQQHPKDPGQRASIDIGLYRQMEIWYRYFHYRLNYRVRNPLDLDLLTESHFSQLTTINVRLNVEKVIVFMRSQVQISSRKPAIMTEVLRGSFSSSS